MHEVNIFGHNFCIIGNDVNAELIKLFPQLIKTNDLMTEFRDCKTCNTVHIVSINKDDLYCDNCNNLLTVRK